MVKEFIRTNSFAGAFVKCPWVTSVSKVRGGYLFEGDDLV
jgi:hypothetical protein